MKTLTLILALVVLSQAYPAPNFLLQKERFPTRLTFYPMDIINHFENPLGQTSPYYSYGFKKNQDKMKLKRDSFHKCLTPNAPVSCFL